MEKKWRWVKTKGTCWGMITNPLESIFQVSFAKSRDMQLPPVLANRECKMFAHALPLVAHSGNLPNCSTAQPIKHPQLFSKQLRKAASHRERNSEHCLAEVNPSITNAIFIEDSPLLTKSIQKSISKSSH